MKFKLDETRSDISTLIKACTAAEQAGQTLPPEVRTILARCAFTLNECRAVMIDSVSTLEEAVAMKAGLMDSISRYDDVSRAKNQAMEHVAGASRRILQQYTPPAQMAQKKQVI